MSWRWWRRWRRWRRSRGTALAAVGEEAGVGIVVPLQPGDRVKDTLDAGQMEVLKLRRGVGDVQTRDAQDRRVERMKRPFLHPGRDLGADTREALCLLDHDTTACLSDRGHHRLVVKGDQGPQVDDLDRPARV